MKGHSFDIAGIYANWNAPKAKQEDDPDAEAPAAVEETERDAPRFVTGDPDEPLDATAIYNKWNGTA